MVKVGQDYVWIGESGEYYTLGKTYRVLIVHGDGCFQMEDDKMNHNWWNEDSMTGNFELKEGPIRTITRREIVPGVYGIVRISGSGKSIDVDMEHDGLTVEQAREAAHLFVQIAEFLEDK